MTEDVVTVAEVNLYRVLGIAFLIRVRVVIFCVAKQTSAVLDSYRRGFNLGTMEPRECLCVRRWLRGLTGFLHCFFLMDIVS